VIAMARVAALREASAVATEATPSAKTTNAGSARPMTGEEYIESIRDGREVYLYGDRVKDVTTHPAFRNSVRRPHVCTMLCTIKRYATF